MRFTNCWWQSRGAAGSAAQEKNIYDELVRVIAGIYRSRILEAPRGLATRPTTDRLRETLFNVLAARIQGRTFADLFAGSGANGIEALSRGARHVYFVENGKAALSAIRENLKALGIGEELRIEGCSVAAFIRRLSKGEGNAAGGQATSRVVKIDIAFLDPPYEDDDAYVETLNLLGGECVSVLAAGAIVVAEHRHKQPLREAYGLLERYRVLKQGDVALSFFKLQTEK